MSTILRMGHAIRDWARQGLGGVLFFTLYGLIAYGWYYCLWWLIGRLPLLAGICLGLAVNGVVIAGGIAWL